MPEVENEPKRHGSGSRAMSMRLSGASAASAREAASAASQDHAESKLNSQRVGVLRDASIVPIAEMSESSSGNEGDGQTALGML